MAKLEADVIVVAAGPAGLAAAIQAAQHGLGVLCFEKGATPGGAANMGMGPFAVESRLQKKELISLTKEEALRMHLAYTHYDVDGRLIRDYFWKSADTIDWLMDMGVEFAAVARYYPGSEQTWHMIKPETGKPGPRAASAMVKRMTERADELGVKFLFETPVQKLLMEDGAVVGVQALDKDGNAVEAFSDAVVIATGGFGSNAEMLEKELGYRLGEDMNTFRIPGIVGDGLRMAWEAGAGRGRMSMEKSCKPRTAEENYPVIVAMAQPAGILVNLAGERLMDEGHMENAAELANVIERQHKKKIFNIIPESMIERYKRTEPDFGNGVFGDGVMDKFDAAFTAASMADPVHFAMADSIEELAQKLCIDAKGLARTVKEYNGFARQNFDPIFGKRREYLAPLEGRLYGGMLNLGAYGTLGGIKINSRLEVVRKDGTPIPGLYGAGTDVCDIYAGTYLYKLPGNTMGFALNSGRLAADHILEYFDALDAEGK